MAAAKSYIETDRQVRSILEDVRSGIFKCVYLLMGDEPYYPELVCNAIIGHCLQEWEKDFNETICYGADVDADTVITAARRFPMMADRQLVLESLREEISNVLNTLSDRERCVIKAFYGIGEPEMTLEEIGNKYGLTRERVRQIKEKAIRHLRSNTKNKLLKAYLGQ